MKEFDNKLQNEMEGLQINDQAGNGSVSEGANTSGADGKVHRGRWCRGNGNNKCHMQRRRMRMFKHMMKEGGGRPHWGAHGMSHMHHHGMPPMMWGGYGQGPHPMYPMYPGMGGMHGYGGVPPPMVQPWMMMGNGGHMHMWKHGFKGCGEHKKHMKKWWKHHSKQQQQQCDGKNSSSEEEDELDLAMGESASSSENDDTSKQESPAGKHDHGVHHHRRMRRAMAMYSGMFPGAMSYGGYMHPHGAVPPPPPPPFVQAFIQRQMCKNRNKCNKKEKEEVMESKANDECPTEQAQSCHRTDKQQCPKEGGEGDDGMKERFPRHMPKWRRAMIMNHCMMYGVPPPPFSPVWMNRKHFKHGHKCGKKHENLQHEGDVNVQEGNNKEGTSVDMDAN